jgi:hypothetical protein
VSTGSVATMMGANSLTEDVRVGFEAYHYLLALE